MFDPVYLAQAKLMLRCLPEVAKYSCFTLKGGTAINFFVRDMPRLSVDIDLTYIHLNDRKTALAEIDDSLRDLADNIKKQISGSRITILEAEGKASRLIVFSKNSQIKIEPNLIQRGTVFGIEERDLSQAVQDQFEMFLTIPCVSLPDLYAGKICAALDRQHPRDLYDVKLLLDNEGITDEIRRAFVVYLASHSRPMHELLAPNLKDIRADYQQHFSGMEKQNITLEELQRVQDQLSKILCASLDETEKHFLLSLMKGLPDWAVLDIGHLPELPALQWKLKNILKMSSAKREGALTKLEKVIDSRSI